MTTRVGINGFGRMGRLVLRALWGTPYLRWRMINDCGADARTSAHLLHFDSVHGRWHEGVEATEDGIVIDGSAIPHTRRARIEDGDWTDCDIVLECTGAFRDAAQLEAYFEQGVKKVIVAAPVKDAGALNVVYGVNDHLYAPERHRLLTAASCTTNCLAPIVKVLLETLGIRRGAFTTVHDATNTQAVVDRPHKDLRRARSVLNNLIVTSTGSATAITMIYPQLKGKLDGHAVRVPLLNASLSDCVFEVARPTDAREVNALFRKAAEGALANILGLEERPLVSSDYRGDSRSCIIDALSTRVVDGTLVKVLAWYDNEWGYVSRMGDLVRKVAAAL